MKRHFRNVEPDVDELLRSLESKGELSRRAPSRRPATFVSRKRVETARRKFHHPPAKNSRSSQTGTISVPLIVAIIGFVGVLGVPFIDPPQTCSSYISEIKELVDSGWEASQFENISDGRVERRCGEAHEIAENWERIFDAENSSSPESGSGNSSGFSSSTNPQ